MYHQIIESNLSDFKRNSQCSSALECVCEKRERKKQGGRKKKQGSDSELTAYVVSVQIPI